MLKQCCPIHLKGSELFYSNLFYLIFMLKYNFTSFAISVRVFIFIMLLGRFYLNIKISFKLKQLIPFHLKPTKIVPR
jgi:hypothetical protein